MGDFQVCYERFGKKLGNILSYFLLAIYHSNEYVISEQSVQSYIKMNFLYLGPEIFHSGVQTFDFMN